MNKRTDSRFPLLPYRMLAKRWRWPALLLIPAGLALYWVFPDVPNANPRLAPLGLVISLVGLLLFVYTLLMRRAHISCHASHFVIHAPLYPVAVSYQRIERIGSAEFRKLFPPEKQKAAIWRLYRRLWGLTVPTISLKALPLPRWWLKLWLHPFLLHPTETGLVIPVDEWMLFIRRTESLRTAWRERR